MWERCTFTNNSAVNKAAWPQYPAQEQLQGVPGSFLNSDAGCGGAFYARGAIVQLLGRSVARGNTALYGTRRAVWPRVACGQHDAWPCMRGANGVQLLVSYRTGSATQSVTYQPRARGPASHAVLLLRFLASAYTAVRTVPNNLVNTPRMKSWSAPLPYARMLQVVLEPWSPQG